MKAISTNLRCPRDQAHDASDGFTLLELLLAAFLFGLLAIATMLVLSRFNSRLNEQYEAGELERRRGIVADLLRYDFDDAGRLLLPPPRRHAAQIAPLFTLTDDFTTSCASDYVSTPGGCRRVSSNPENTPPPWAVTDYGLYADGFIQFRPPQTGASVTGLTGARRTIIGLQFIPDPDTGKTKINSYLKPANSQAQTGFLDNEHLAGDRYRVTIEVLPNNRLTVVYYRLRTGWSLKPMGQSITIEADFPYRAITQIKQLGEAVNDIILAGSLNGTIVMQDAQLPALLPTDGPPPPTDKRMDNVVTIDTTDGTLTSVTLLRADPTIDAAFLETSFGANEAQSLKIQTPSCGARPYQVSDVLMLMDTEGAREVTVLCRITKVVAAGNCKTHKGTILNVSQIRRAQAAWGKIYSLAGDFSHQFPRLAMVARIAEPITYEQEGTKLWRIVGNRKVLAALGVEDFDVVKRGSNEVHSFEVTCRLRSEGFFTQATEGAQGVATVKYEVAPRAMNERFERQAVEPSVP